MFVTPFSQRIIAGTSASVGWSQIDGLGEPADPGTVTVNVTRADGTVIVTGGATAGTATAERTYALSVAQTAVLDRLTVDWIVSGVTVASTEVDVVAAPWFSNAELRSAQPTVSVAADFPADEVADVRLRVEWLFERVTGQRFVPGYAYRTIRGASGFDLVLPHPPVRRVRSAALYDDPSSSPVETLGAVELAAIPPSESGVITRYSGLWSSRWVKIGYEHGMVAPPPDLKSAAMLYTRHLLTGGSSGVDMRVLAQSAPDGSMVQLASPGRSFYVTGLPEVDEVLRAWTFRDVGIA